MGKDSGGGGDASAATENLVNTLAQMAQQSYDSNYPLLNAMQGRWGQFLGADMGAESGIDWGGSSGGGENALPPGSNRFEEPLIPDVVPDRTDPSNPDYMPGWNPNNDPNYERFPTPSKEFPGPIWGDPTIPSFSNDVASRSGQMNFDLGNFNYNLPTNPFQGDMVHDVEGSIPGRNSGTGTDPGPFKPSGNPGDSYSWGPGSFDVTASPLWSSAKMMAEDTYGVARDETLENLPVGGGMWEALADTSRDKARTLTGAASGISQDEYNKIYGAVTGVPAAAMGGMGSASSILGGLAGTQASSAATSAAGKSNALGGLGGGIGSIVGGKK